MQSNPTQICIEYLDQMRKYRRDLNLKERKEKRIDQMPTIPEERYCLLFSH
jgi:hypothetical protein